MTKKPVEVPGINIQWPWSEHLLAGRKTVETRSYPLPAKYAGQRLAVIETPGPSGKKLAGIGQARVTGTIVFSGSFQYLTYEAWLDDFSRHLVDPDNAQCAFDPSKPKWGWVVKSFDRFVEPKPAPKVRGIVFASSCII